MQTAEIKFFEIEIEIDTMVAGDNVKTALMETLKEL